MKWCCISSTIAARIIAMVGLATTILMINVLVSDYFSRSEEEFFEAIKMWAMVGLHWTEIVMITQIANQAGIILLLFLGYSVLSLICSSFLAFGTVYRHPKCTIPWLHLQLISVLDQTVALTFHILYAPKPLPGSNPEPFNWNVLASSIYLLITIYFWVTVYAAREDWTFHVRPASHVVYYQASDNNPEIDSNVPKSPSYTGHLNAHECEAHTSAHIDVEQ
ncbi:uncharacterized protein LOC135160222 [Diachasmimorpha longicaudata]|uniref:uncharacterized protein LOC135160222 n=1 Tax=Diachasmimorpha longicaudata TaxID=58733 RepID=UPI0030B8E50E